MTDLDLQQELDRLKFHNISGRLQQRKPRDSQIATLSSFDLQHANQVVSYRIQPPS